MRGYIVGVTFFMGVVGNDSPRLPRSYSPSIAVDRMNFHVSTTRQFEAIFLQCPHIWPIANDVYRAQNQMNLTSAPSRAFEVVT